MYSVDPHLVLLLIWRNAHVCVCVCVMMMMMMMMMAIAYGRCLANPTGVLGGRAPGAPPAHGASSDTVARDCAAPLSGVRQAIHLPQLPAVCVFGSEARAGGAALARCAFVRTWIRLDLEHDVYDVYVHVQRWICVPRASVCSILYCTKLSLHAGSCCRL